MPYASIKPLERSTTVTSLHKMKTEGEKFTTVALYDAPMAQMAQQCGVEVLLVGDSLGMTVLGFDSTVPVTMEQMIYHVEAVKRGSDRALIIGDLPFMTYATMDDAMHNAARIMRAGANMVKLEGGAWLVETVRNLSERGIPVCAHLGLTPQSVNKFGGFRVQGKSQEQADQILADAIALDEAGADLVVLECIPEALGEKITAAVGMPTVGIGAGRYCDAQVLVINDILGLTPKPPKFSKNFLVEAGDIPGALKKFSHDVKNGIFPSEDEIFC